MPARPCLFVACAPSGSRIHPPYVKLFRKNCPAESTRIVERPTTQGPEQLPNYSPTASHKGSFEQRTAHLRLTQQPESALSEFASHVTDPHRKGIGRPWCFY